MMNEDISKEKGPEAAPEEDSYSESGIEEKASNSENTEPLSEEEDERDGTVEPSEENDDGVDIGIPGPADSSVARAEAADEAEDIAGLDPPDKPAEQPLSADGEDPDPQAPAVVESREGKSRMHWYVVHTYSGRKARVRDTVERLIKASDFKDKFGNVLVATEEVAEMKKGKKKVSLRKLFPSYILIEMEMTNQTWSLVENVPGVTHFVGGDEKPSPISKKEVDRILGLSLIHI